MFQNFKQQVVSLFFKSAPEEKITQREDLLNPIQIYRHSFSDDNGRKHVSTFIAEIETTQKKIENAANRRIAFRWYIAALMLVDRDPLAERLCVTIENLFSHVAYRNMNPAKNMLNHIGRKCPELIQEIKDFSNDDPEWQTVLTMLLNEKPISRQLRENFSQIKFRYFEEKKQHEMDNSDEIPEAVNTNRVHFG